MKKKVSLKDIANKVGVSTALVSYVLNNQKEGRIGKEISAKIRSTALRMNYRPNQIAKSLKTNKTLTIGLIVANISNPFFSSLARIIEDEVNRANYTVLFGSSDENAEKFAKLIDTFLNRQVDGLVICPPENSEAQLQYLQKQGTPFVLVDRYFPSVNTSYVVLDNKDAAYRASKHFLDQGRKRVGLITYKTKLFHLLERKAGYLAALKEQGITFKKSWLKEVDISSNRTEIEEAVAQLLSLDPAVDAILFASNTIASCAVKFINTLPLKVPDQLAVICFDETDSLDLFYAPLTYVKQPLLEIGQMVSRILVENICTKPKIEQVSMKAELIVRQSTM